MAEALDAVLPIRIDQLAHHVLEAVSARHLTLACAESCTGGLLASLLNDIPARSHVFERGLVVYADSAKTERLGVDPALIRLHSAVSEPVARAVAEGAGPIRRGRRMAITGWT